jgi:hypothetical protein
MKKELIKPTLFYIILFLFLFAFSTIAKNYDYDFWARLIAGMGVVEAGQVLKQDFLSYAPTHIWFDHEWGSGVVFYLVQKFFSNFGLLLLQSTLTFLIFVIITRIVALRGVKTTSAYNFLFYYFAFIAMSYIINSPVRCQMFSFIFFALFLYILELARKGNDKSLWSMPFLMIIWNNLHGGCVSGIGLIVLYIIGEFLNRKPIKKYIYPLIGTVLVLPINPWGFEYIKFLFEANTMQRPDIAEWWGLFSKFFMFKYIKFKIFAAIILLIEFGVILKQLISKKFYLDKTKFLVLGVTIFLAIEHVKLIPFAIITMTSFLYDDFYTAFNFLTKNIFNKIANIKDSIVYTLTLIFVISNINTKIFEPRLDYSRYPVLGVEFIKINQIKGNLLLNFGLAGYASYQLYPNNKIYIDGRYEEVFYEGMLPLLRKFYLANPGWDEVLIKHPPDIMIIEKFYPISSVLKQRQEWKNVFEDKFFIVFVKTKNAKKTYTQPSLDINHYRKHVFDTNIKFMLQSKHETN